MSRREYKQQLRVNNRLITKVIIDDHFELKHSDSISDEIILRLVATLNERRFQSVDRDGEFEYFVEDKIDLDGKLYKLIWLLEDDEIYVGVVNAYRR
ncbi:MAG: hypothetical protein H6624_15455 [Bdellovibrionaceae bacterium]|nr:hypothetical protein [Pseudobdellovibrionaceae bacterium]